MRLHRVDLMTRGRARRARDRSAVRQKCVHRSAAKEPARESIFSKRELLQGAYLQGSQALRRGGDGDVERAAHRLEALAAVPPGRAATPASVYAAGDVFFPSPAAADRSCGKDGLVLKGAIGTPPTPPADHTIETGVLRAF